MSSTGIDEIKLIYIYVYIVGYTPANVVYCEGVKVYAGDPRNPSNVSYTYVNKQLNITASAYYVSETSTTWKVYVAG